MSDPVREALERLVAAEREFEAETTLTLDDPISDAVKHAEEVLKNEQPN
jgi:hypothetical protein